MSQEILVPLTEDNTCSALLILGCQNLLYFCFPDCLTVRLLSLSLQLLLLQYSNSYSCCCCELELSALSAERSMLFHHVPCTVDNKIL